MLRESACPKPIPSVHLAASCSENSSNGFWTEGKLRTAFLDEIRSCRAPSLTSASPPPTKRQTTNCRRSRQLASRSNPAALSPRRVRATSPLPSGAGSRACSMGVPGGAKWSPGEPKIARRESLAADLIIPGSTFEALDPWRPGGLIVLRPLQQGAGRQLGRRVRRARLAESPRRQLRQSRLDRLQHRAGQRGADRAGLQAVLR